MTWNSQDNMRLKCTIASFFCCVFFAACVAAPLTDTPAPPVMVGPAIPSTEGQYHRERVQIRNAEAHVVSKEDPWIKRIVHPDDYRELRNPLLISAEVVSPFGDLLRTASPVIVLNGWPLSNSIVVSGKVDRVYAVSTTSERLGHTIRVQVGWLGALSETISEPIDLKFEQVK